MAGNKTEQVALRGRHPGFLNLELDMPFIEEDSPGAIGDSEIHWTYLEKWTRHWNQLQVMESMRQQQEVAAARAADSAAFDAFNKGN